MKKFFLFAITALLISCGNKASSNTDTTSEAVPDSCETTATSTDEPSLRECTSFSTKFRKDENGQVDAIILTCDIDNKKQEFTCEFNWPKDEGLLDEAGEIEEVDVNFDGVPDVMMTLGDFGVNPELFPTIFYGVFIWNEATGEFEQSTALEDKPNLVLDAEKKLIISNYETVVGDHYHEEYAWEDGKLKLVEERQVYNYEDEE